MLGQGHRATYLNESLCSESCAMDASWPGAIRRSLLHHSEGHHLGHSNAHPGLRRGRAGAELDAQDPRMEPDDA